jgi:diguanylate cyclase (GGDEF)-like protein
MLALTLGVVVVSGYLDYVGGMALSLPLIHLVPLTLAAWFGGRRIGYMFAFLSAAVLAWVTVANLPPASSRLVASVNVVIELLVYLFIAYLVSGSREIRDRLEERARTDPLTGIANSRAFLELADVELERARRYGHPCTLAYMDLDNFKLVNDTLGHQAGDRLLQSVALALRSHCRKVDLVARMGGDEFAVLLPETDGAGSEAFSKKIQQAIREILQKWHPSLTVSVGIVSCNTMPENMDKLIQMADSAMYQVKSDQKDGIVHEHYDQGVMDQGMETI